MPFAAGVKHAVAYDVPGLVVAGDEIDEFEVVGAQVGGDHERPAGHGLAEGGVGVGVEIRGVGGAGGGELFQLAGDEVGGGAAGFHDVHLGHAAGEGAAGLAEHGDEAQNDDGKEGDGDEDFDERECVGGEEENMTVERSPSPRPSPPRRGGTVWQRWTGAGATGWRCAASSRRG